jgi:cobyrinic acid a,c-diamide synthase
MPWPPPGQVMSQQGRGSQGAADARNRPASYSPLCEQADDKADAAPCEPLQAFLLAATHSGAGKTTISLGLMAALGRQGLAVQPFKCGPDFIDPTLHRMVTGRISRNLDLRMCGEEYVARTFRQRAAEADISVVEGVMGLFDGGIGSPAALARALGLPVILVVDVKGIAESIAAVVKGFEDLDPDLDLIGVIFNRVGSARHLELVSSAVRAHCRTPILGALPKNPEFAIPDRHLGLMMGTELPLTARQLDSLATVEENIDLEAIKRLAVTLPAAVSSPPFPERSRRERGGRNETKGKCPRIGIARDQAFCFYYQDNLELLQGAGAELVEFSPLTDPTLPPGLDGLYLGGGYPELHGAALSKNQSLLAEIRAWSAAGRPLYAECGGFIYLCQGVVDLDGAFWPLAGIFPTRATMRPRLAHLGYREATITAHSILGTDGTLFGHEFHYSEIEAMPAAIDRVFRLPDGRQEGYRINNTLAGYLHLHFGRTPEAARHFVTLCLQCGESP